MSEKKEEIPNEMPQGWKGHKWREYELGKPDNFALDHDHHNGYACVKCGFSFCEHCENWKNIEACDVPDQFELELELS